MDNRSGPQSSHRITSVRGSYTRRRHGRLLVQQDDEDEAPTIVGTDGPYLTDARGKRYLDFRSGWNVGNFGWNNRLLAEAVRTFQGPPYVYPEHRYEPWFELAALLLDLAPRRLQRCFRATGGTEAVDLALQMAMRHTGRRERMASGTRRWARAVSRSTRVPSEVNAIKQGPARRAGSS